MSFKLKNFPNFAYRFSIHERALFGRFLGPYSPSMVQYYRKSHQRQYSRKKKYCLKIFWWIQVFMEKGRTQISVIELSKYVKIKSLSSLPFPGKIGLLLAIFGIFLPENRVGSQVKGGESKFDKYYFIHTIPGQLPVKKFWFKYSNFVAIDHRGHFRRTCIFVCSFLITLFHFETKLIR